MSISEVIKSRIDSCLFSRLYFWWQRRPFLSNFELEYFLMTCKRFDLITFPKCTNAIWIQLRTRNSCASLEPHKWRERIPFIDVHEGQLHKKLNNFFSVAKHPMDIITFWIVFSLLALNKKIVPCAPVEIRIQIRISSSFWIHARICFFFRTCQQVEGGMRL